jgi:putative aldouronate transport system substrate-binding protein
MQESADTNFSLMMASGDLTDLIRYGATGYPNGLSGALEQDQIVNLTSYLADYAPSYNYILEVDDQINLDVRTDDGDVLGFFQIYSQDGGYDISIARGPVMRQDLLDDLGVDVPTTYDELTDVLLAFKTEYDLSDPIWIGNSGFSDDSALIGGYDVTNGFYQIDGQVHYGPLEDGFEDYLTMMHSWYEAGILNSDFISYEDNPNSPTNEGLKYSGQAGMHYCSGSNMDNYNNDSTCEDPDFQLVAVPFIAGKDGINHFGQDTFAVKPMGCMTVTTGCKNVELAIEWCDFWYSDAGSMLSNYGIEGQTFEYDDEGQPHWTEFVTNNPDGVSYVVCRQVYLTLTQQPGIYNMDMELERLSDNGKNAIEVWNASADGAYLITSCYSMDADESEELSAILSDINTLNDESWIKFITGDKSLDEYDAYVEMLYSMNIERAIEIYQDALDRYYAR